MPCDHGYDEPAKYCAICRLTIKRLEAQVQADNPLTPFNGTSGWSGTDTSRDRAIRQDSNGTTSKRQKAVLALITSSGTTGITWKDISDALRVHHGAASGVLSVLHKAGLISRLSERRDGMKVYVRPQFVGERPSEKYGPKRRPCSNCGHIEEDQ